MTDNIEYLKFYDGVISSISNTAYDKHYRTGTFSGFQLTKMSNEATEVIEQAFYNGKSEADTVAIIENL